MADTNCTLPASTAWKIAGATWSWQKAAYEEEVRILASIARATYDARSRDELAAANGIEEVTRVLAQSAKRRRDSQRPKKRGPDDPGEDLI